MSQKFQSLVSQVNLSNLRSEEAMEQDRMAGIVRRREDDKIKEALARFQEVSAAFEAENGQLKHRLEQALAEINQLRLAVKDAELNAADKKLEKSMLQLRDALSTEMARTREEQNSVGELLMSKDLEIKELQSYKNDAEEKLELAGQADNEAKIHIMTLEVHNKSLVAQLEALQVRLAGAAELEALTKDIRQTVSGEHAMTTELIAEKVSWQVSVDAPRAEQN
jgi:chromosome segregation ATPase